MFSKPTYNITYDAGNQTLRVDLANGKSAVLNHTTKVEYKKELGDLLTVNDFPTDDPAKLAAIHLLILCVKQTQGEMNLKVHVSPIEGKDFNQCEFELRGFAEVYRFLHALENEAKKGNKPYVSIYEDLQKQMVYATFMMANKKIIEEEMKKMAGFNPSSSG